MYGRQGPAVSPPKTGCHTFESYYQVFLKLVCISNLDMLVIGFISLVLMKLNYAN